MPSNPNPMANPPLWKWLAGEFLAIAALGVILGFLGPFGTYAMPLADRLLYWIGFGLAGYCLFRPIALAGYWLAQISAIPLWLAQGIATAIAALPLTFLVGHAIAQIIGIQGENPFWNARFPTLYFQVWGIGMLTYLLMHMLFHGARNATERAENSPEQSDALSPERAGALLDEGADADADAGEDTGAVTIADEGADAERDRGQKQAPNRTQLHQRLSPGFPEAILALNAEDHYVHVYGEQPGGAGEISQDAQGEVQKEMLLMRLTDAIQEMEGVEGVQVHRSWWAARAAMQGTYRDGRNLRLKLRGGLDIPVARNKAQDL